MKRRSQVDPEIDLIECPHCHRLTDRVPVEVDGIDWASVLVIGFWALLLPSTRTSDLQCRKCGKTFLATPYEMTTGDRIIGGALLSFTVLVVGAVAWLFIHFARS